MFASVERVPLCWEKLSCAAESAGSPTQCSRYPALAAVLSAKRCTAESSTLRTARGGSSLWRDSVRRNAGERAIGVTVISQVVCLLHTVLLELMLQLYAACRVNAL